MPRRRQVPDPGEFDVPRARLWQWLVEHAGADPDRHPGDRAKARKTEIHRIHYESRTSGDPGMGRAGAVAGALLDLDMAAAERTTAAWYLRWRAEALDKATQAAQSVTALIKASRALAERAAADRSADIPAMVSYWPEAVAAELAARAAGLAAAAFVVLDYKGAVENGEHVWGSDTDPSVLGKMDSIALLLADGGFSPEQCAELLDETGGERALKIDRWRKRIEWARKATRRSAPGAAVSSAARTSRPSGSSRAARSPRPRTAAVPRPRGRHPRR